MSRRSGAPPFKTTGKSLKRNDWEVVETYPSSRESFTRSTHTTSRCRYHMEHSELHTTNDYNTTADSDRPRPTHAKISINGGAWEEAGLLDDDQLDFVSNCEPSACARLADLYARISAEEDAKDLYPGSRAGQTAMAMLRQRCAARNRECIRCNGFDFAPLTIALSAETSVVESADSLESAVLVRLL